MFLDSVHIITHSMQNNFAYQGLAENRFSVWASLAFQRLTFYSSWRSYNINKHLEISLYLPYIYTHTVYPQTTLRNRTSVNLMAVN